MHFFIQLHSTLVFSTTYYLNEIHLIIISSLFFSFLLFILQMSLDKLNPSVWWKYLREGKGPLSSPGGCNSVAFVHTDAKHDHRYQRIRT